MFVLVSVLPSVTPYVIIPLADPGTGWHKPSLQPQQEGDKVHTQAGKPCLILSSAVCSVQITSSSGCQIPPLLSLSVSNALGNMELCVLGHFPSVMQVDSGVPFCSDFFSRQVL